MKLYVVSTKFQPVVHFQACAKSMKQVWPKPPSTDELLATFNASRTDTLIACDNKDVAMEIAHYLIDKACKEDSIIPKKYFDPSIICRATPVIYTIDIDRTTISPSLQTLSLTKLANYPDFTTIPGFKKRNIKAYYEEFSPHYKKADYEVLSEHAKQFAKNIFDEPTIDPTSPEHLLMDKIRHLVRYTTFWQLNNLQRENVIEATYYDASNKKIDVNLSYNPTLNFFSSAINLFSSSWWEDKPVRYP